MAYSWRVRTTAASKLPLDWRDQGIRMAKRIAYFMQLYKVHPSLVVNMDQTGVHLAPVDNKTYNTRGGKDVKLIGADDKRQITACLASSLDGDLLPLFGTRKRAAARKFGFLLNSQCIAMTEDSE